VNGGAVAATVTYDEPPIDAGTYTATAATNDANYMLTNNSKQFAIAPRQLEISEPSMAATKVYDGTRKADFAIGSLTNLVVGDDVTVSAQAEYNGADVADASEITITYSISGAKAANYIAPAAKKYAASVTPRDAAAGGLSIDAIPAQRYTGAPLEPALTVRFGQTALAAGRDYDAEYSNNTAVGTATAKAVLKGNYKGALTRTFAIAGRPLSNSDVVIGSIDAQTYDGTEKKPAPTVTLKDGNKLLTKDTDYSLEYSNNVNAGTATVTVLFMGNYGGSASATFAIGRATPTVDVTPYAGTLYEGGKPPALDYTASVPGRLAFVQTSLGGTGDYDWVFTPADASNYNAVTGKMSLTVTPVALERIGVSFAQNRTFYETTALSAVEDYVRSNAVVTGVNNDGSTAVLSQAQFTVAAGDIENGRRRVTIAAVSDGSKTAVIYIALTQRVLESITIKTPPSKVEYIAGETLDTDGMYVEAKYSSGETENATFAAVVSYINGGSFGAGDKYAIISFTAAA
jgi:hypothetical protein